MKGITNLGILVILLIAGAVAVQQGWIRLPFAVSYQDYLSGTCKVGVQTFATLKCENVGDDVPMATVYLQRGYYLQIKDMFGNVLCTTENPNVFHINVKNQCQNFMLTNGQTYKFVSAVFLGTSEVSQTIDFDNAHVTNINWNTDPIQIQIYGWQKWITITYAPQGIDHVKLEGTEGCSDQSWLNALRQTTNSSLSKIGVGTSVTDGDDDKNGNIAFKQDRVVSARVGDSALVPIYITEAAGISNPANVNGQLGICDPLQKKVIGFTRYDTATGCWIRADSSQVLIDGTVSTADKFFACTQSQCALQGSNYTWENYFCVKQPTGAVSVSQCTINSDCGLPFYKTDSTGTSFKITPICSAGICDASKYQQQVIACDPTQSYSPTQDCPNGRVCIADSSGNYTLACRTQALLDPRQSLGAGACAINSTTYIDVPPAPGQICCSNGKIIGKDIQSGVGFSMTEAQCKQQAGFNLDAFFRSLGLGPLLDFFNGIASGLGNLIVIIIIIIIIFLLFKLFGGRGGGGGSSTIIITR